MKQLETATEPKALSQKEKSGSWDVIIVGAGPSGLATAIELKRRGFSTLNIDKGCVVNSLFNYPTNMTFFTTPELLEIGEIPFSTENNRKPNRAEALEYYRKVTDHYKLEVRQYEKVDKIQKGDGAFEILTIDRHGREAMYNSRKVIVATGYYDLTNRLKAPGEDLEKVLHYYREPHPYYDTDVVVVGGKNSAAIAALELYRHNARVTLVHRGPGIHSHVKYWIKPDIENRIKAKEVKAYFNSYIREITEDEVVIATPDGDITVKNDFVFALIGYHPDYQFLTSSGIELTADQCRPVCDPVTLESNVPGIYVAGVIVAGAKTNEIFIENGRFHGRQIASDIAGKLKESDDEDDAT